VPDENLLQRYADLVVRVGANVGEGQDVIIRGYVEHAPFVRALTRAAYEAGARYVAAAYTDQYVKRELIVHGSDEVLEWSPPWRFDELEYFAGAVRRIEVAAGIHRSISHVAGFSVPSDVYSLDWMTKASRLEFTGAMFFGRNVAPLGTGAIRQGYVLSTSGVPSAVHTAGGWAQLKYRIRAPLWVNLFSGQQDDRNSDLLKGSIGKNLVWGANVFYRLAPNVLASFEASQTRTSYMGRGMLLTNHYDLAFGYLF
jgi:hypothetical protein